MTYLIQVVYVRRRVDAPFLKIFYATRVVLCRKRSVQGFDDVLRRPSIPIGDLLQEGQRGDVGVHWYWMDGSKSNVVIWGR